MFLDTNVLVAAYATRGLCADLVRLVLARHELLLSSTVLEELERALSDKLHTPQEMAREIVAFPRVSASVVETPADPPVPVRDPDDAVILGAALAGKADVLVSGDKDLLDLEEIPGLRIVDPRRFWQLASEPPRS